MKGWRRQRGIERTSINHSRRLVARKGVKEDAGVAAATAAHDMAFTAYARVSVAIAWHGAPQQNQTTRGVLSYQIMTTRRSEAEQA